MHQTNIDEACTLAIIAHCTMTFNLNRHLQPKRLFLICTDVRNISQTKPYTMYRPSHASSHVPPHVPHRKHKHLTGIHIKTCITRHPSRSSNFHPLRLPQMSRPAVTKCHEHKPVHYWICRKSEGWFTQHHCLTFSYLTYTSPKHWCLECRVPDFLLELVATLNIKQICPGDLYIR